MDYYTNIIKKQKEIASMVLDGLEIICPWARLAGGAPRDWFFDNYARDLDFYYCVDPSTTWHEQEAQLNKVLPKKLDLRTIGAWENIPTYNTMPGIKNISTYYASTIEFNEKIIKPEFRIQLIRMNTKADLMNAVKDFAVSISKVWWKNNTTHTTDDFLLTIATKTMWLNDGYSWHDPYCKKMSKRFPKYNKAINKDAVVSKALSKTLQSVRNEYKDNY